jgi:antitoxin ParD1/3/4
MELRGGRRSLKAMEVALAPDIEEMVRPRLETGRYPTEAAVFREALHVLRERDADYGRRLEELRADIAIGLADIERGDVEEWDVEAIIAECHKT